MNRFQDWLDQAERDLGRAELDVQYLYWEWACFTAQQAGEKAVKGLLLSHGTAVRGHAITLMMRHAAGIPFPADLIACGQLLDGYYMATRYPNGFPEGKPADYFNQEKAEQALDAARKILRFCNDHLHRSG